MDEFEYEEKDVDEFIEEDKQEVITEEDEESVQDENVMVLSDVETDDDEVSEIAVPLIEEGATKEIKFDPRLHIQHMTLNEMTKIVINIDDMINNNVMQIPKGTKRADFIYNIIVQNKLDIVIKRPIDFTSVVVVSLSDLKINKNKLREKLNKLFS